jgi:hypothetical protein
VDPFTLSDQLFVKNFKLTKDLNQYLIELLLSFIKVKTITNNNALHKSLNGYKYAKRK